MSTYICKFNGRPQLCCNTDLYRPAFNNVWFKGDYLYATDGHILIREHKDIHDFYPGAWEQFDGYCLDKSLLDLIKKNEFFVQDGFIKFWIGQHLVKVKISELFDEQTYVMPNFETMIQKTLNAPLFEQHNTMFDTALLHRISNAFGRTEWRRVQLNFRGNNRTGIVVTTKESTVMQLGILMPVLTL